MIHTYLQIGMCERFHVCPRLEMSVRFERNSLGARILPGCDLPYKLRVRHDYLIHAMRFRHIQGRYSSAAGLLILQTSRVLISFRQGLGFHSRLTY